MKLSANSRLTVMVDAAELNPKSDAYALSLLGSRAATVQANAPRLRGR